MERGTFQDSAAKLFNAFRLMLENVAISKYTVGKLMSTNYIKFVNSFVFLNTFCTCITITISFFNFNLC